MRTTTAPTLDELRWKIADKVPEFRQTCRKCNGLGYYQFQGGNRSFSGCGLCGGFECCAPLEYIPSGSRGTGYIPKPAIELAEILWRRGWRISIDYFPKNSYLMVGVRSREMLLDDDKSMIWVNGTEPWLTLAQAVVKALE